MSSTENRLSRTFDLLRRHLEREREQPVTPWVSAEELRGQFPLQPPAEGLDDDTLFERLESLVATTPRTTTRRFFNQLFSGRDDFGSIGEILAAFLNSSMYTFKAAGPQVILERELVGHMGRRIGYPDADGTFVPGGSMANLAGMLLARNKARPDSRNQGVDGKRLVFYASACCHYSVPKAAGILGIGRDNLRHVKVDERGRMIPSALRERIEADLAAGHEPFLVMATAGTTVRGAYDPNPPIADLCDEFGLWLHIDGAMGGSALMSDTHRALLEGSERSDSFAWDAHKLMGVPLSCSAILVRERGPLFESLSEQASYLFQNDSAEYDLGQISLQCGRRNDALKLWAAWQHHGDRGFSERIDRLFTLTRHAESIVTSDPELELSCPVESITVCFEVTGHQSELLCEALRRNGDAVVGYSIVGSRKVIRLAITNGAMTEQDVNDFFTTLKAMRSPETAGENAVAAIAC
jgi:sulfinoalanine decarboxylase/sulfinoalanine decarboxylase/aspartate 1-decarboxylase